MAPAGERPSRSAAGTTCETRPSQRTAASANQGKSAAAGRKTSVPVARAVAQALRAGRAPDAIAQAAA